MTASTTFAIPSNPPKVYGFIGLGSMGYGMASNVARSLPSGTTLIVYDAWPASLERFRKEFNGDKILVAGSVVEVARRADLLVTVLPGPKESRAVWTEMLPEVTQGKVLIECATVGVELVKEMAPLVAARGGTMVDAPISGGVAGANNGTLTFMAGVEDSTPDPTGERSVDATTPILQYARVILDAMGKNVYLCGPPGTGQVAKLANNLLVYQTMVGLAESLRMAEAHGVHPRLATEIMKRSTARSWVLEGYHPVPGIVPGLPASRGYQMPGFPVTGGIKDVKCALDCAKSAGTPATMGEASLRTLEAMAADERFVKRDFSVVWEWLGEQREAK
ncbi:hypothetical protein HDU93_008138 [Gonapodya sp. JEL0774]|nr:hypothetical protein HDU93_008138 [Gonapodya sp. JEL0774]